VPVGSDGEYAIVDGSAVKRRTLRPRRQTAASKRVFLHKPLWQRVYDRYKAGFVGCLLVLDTLALGVFLVDAARFVVVRGKTLGATGRVAGDAASQGEIITPVLSVLAFFLIALPFVTSLLPKYLEPDARAGGRKAVGAGRRAARRSRSPRVQQILVASRPRWKRLLLARGRPVVCGHLAIAVLIPFLTVLAYTMQVLCGFQNHNAVNSFASYWMVVVERINWMSSVIFVPTLLKFVVRFFGHEGPHVGEVFKEVGTEFKMEAGH